MKQKPVSLWIDQYGDRIFARTQRELREKCGGGRIFPIYCDREDGVYRVGTGVGQRWFTQWTQVEKRV